MTDTDTQLADTDTNFDIINLDLDILHLRFYCDLIFLCIIYLFQDLSVPFFMTWSQVVSKGYLLHHFQVETCKSQGGHKILLEMVMIVLIQEAVEKYTRTTFHSPATSIRH